MSRSRVLSARVSEPFDRPPRASSDRESSTTAGALAAGTWLRARGGSPPATTRWHVEIELDVIQESAPTEFDERTATRFHVDIYAEEWGFYVCHGGHSTWIRVTDVAFLHGRDDFKLLGQTPPLRGLGTLLRAFERQHRVQFQRAHARVTTNVPGIEPEIRAWIATL